MNTVHGPASRCEHCKKTEKKKYDWALKKGFTYSKSIDCFIQLCRSCHLKYDFTEERAKKNKTARLGFKNSDDHKKKLRDANLGKTHSEKSKKLMSKAAMGRVAWNKGVPDLSKNKKREISALYNEGKSLKEIILLGFNKNTARCIIYKIKKSKL